MKKKRSLIFWRKKTGYILVTVLAVAGVLGWAVLTATDNSPTAPEDCILCSEKYGTRHHAPCLLELSSGQITELEIYRSNMGRPWEIAEQQDMNRCVMTWSASRLPLFITCTPERQECFTYLEMGEEKLSASYFCQECIYRLSEAASSGTVLLDLYDLGDIRVDRIEPGISYTVRDYSVVVTEEEGRLQITATGHLF